MDAQVAVDFGGVKDVQGAVQAVGEVVGDIDEGGYRAQADGFETVGQPRGGGTVFDAANDAACENGAGFGFEGFVDMDGDRAGELAFDRDGVERFQSAQTARGEVTGDAANPQSIGAVGGDLNVDHRIVQAAVVDEPRTQRGVCGQVDDAVVIIGQHQFAFRTQHAIGFDAANDAGLQVYPCAGNMGADGGEHADQAGAGIGGTANDLYFLGWAIGAIGPGFHPAQAQAVGVGVGCCVNHPADAERAEGCCGVFHAFNLVPDIGQRIGDLIKACVGFKVIVQPGEGEFHRVSP